MASDKIDRPTTQAGMAIGRKQRGAAGLLAVIGGLGIASEQPLLKLLGVGALVLTALLLVVVVVMRVRYLRNAGAPANPNLVRNGLVGSGSVVIGALVVVLGSQSERYGIVALIAGFALVAVGLFVFFRRIAEPS